MSLSAIYEDFDEENKDNKQNNFDISKTMQKVLHLTSNLEEDKSKRTKVAYLPKEIMGFMNDLKLNKTVLRGQDHYTTITYKDRVVQIETPKCLFMFGLEKYRNPEGKYDKYSIHLSLREICRDAENNVREFRYLLENLDLFAMGDKFDEPNLKYWSPIRPNHKQERKPPVLRVKVPSDASRLKITMATEDGKVSYYPLVSEFEKIFHHRNEVKCILQINPVWYAGNKFGISYKLIKIQLADSGRRDIEFRN